jgi:hypothetical protein
MILDLSPSTSGVVVFVLTTVFAAVAARVFYNVYLHPLAGFHGPWYASATSLTNAIVSLRNIEPEWLLGMTRKYGSKHQLPSSYCRRVPFLIP